MMQNKGAVFFKRNRRNYANIIIKILIKPQQSLLRDLAREKEVILK